MSLTVTQPDKQPWLLEEYLQEHAPMTETQPTVPPVTPPVTEVQPPASNAALISRLEAEKSALAQNFAKVQAESEATAKRLAELESAAKAAEEARLKEREDYKTLWQNSETEKNALLAKQTEFSKRQALASEFAKQNALDVELLTDAALAKSGDKIIVQDGHVLGVEAVVGEFKTSKSNLFKPDAPAATPGAVNNPLVPLVKPTGNAGTMPPADGSPAPFNAMTAEKADLDKAWEAELVKMKSEGRRSI